MLPLGRLLDPLFRVSSLSEPPFSIEARHALALARLTGGELAIAASDLDALVDEVGDDDVALPLLERNRVRAHELNDLRADFFIRCRDGVVKLRFEIGGRTRVATVQRIDADGLTLTLSKGETTKVPIEAVTMEMLVKVCDEQKLEIGGAAARAFAQFLRGRKNWKRAAAGGSPAETALVEDEATLNHLLALGHTVAGLDEVARTPLAIADEDSAQRTLAILQELRKAEVGASLVTERARPLRQLAIQVLARSFTARGLSDSSWDESIHGRLERLEGERVRITWTFDDPAHVLDWDNLTHPEWTGFTLQTQDLDARLTVEEGALRALGKHYLRNKLQFIAPMTVTWQLAIEPPSSPDTDATATSFDVAICQQGHEMIFAHGWDTVACFDGHEQALDGYPTEYRYEVAYSAVLEHDGQNAELTSPGLPQRSVPVFGRRFGYVTLDFVTDLVVRLDEFSIEGTIAPVSVIVWRDDWIEKELVRLGLE